MRVPHGHSHSWQKSVMLKDDRSNRWLRLLPSTSLFPRIFSTERVSGHGFGRGGVRVPITLPGGLICSVYHWLIGSSLGVKDDQGRPRGHIVTRRTLLKRAVRSYPNREGLLLCHNMTILHPHLVERDCGFMRSRALHFFHQRLQHPLPITAGREKQHARGDLVVVAPGKLVGGRWTARVVCQGKYKQ